jgi:3'-5' exoribonuclease
MPKDATPETLKHKIVLFVNIEDKGKYYSANWLDMVVSNREDIEPDSPLLKIKLKGDIDSKQLLSRLLQIVSETEMPLFWEAFFKSEAVAEAIKDYEKFPAGAKVHHPWENGLSTHTEEALTAYMQLSKVYYLKEIKHHVCIAALLFHDWGKTKEYSRTSEWKYTDEMPLFGHVYMSAKKACNVLDKFRQSYEFENEEQERQAIRDIQFAEHCILAHHGIKEFGSPVTPGQYPKNCVNRK